MAGFFLPMRDERIPRSSKSSFSLAPFFSGPMQSNSFKLMIELLGIRSSRISKKSPTMWREMAAQEHRQGRKGWPIVQYLRAQDEGKLLVHPVLLLSREVEHLCLKERAVVYPRIGSRKGESILFFIRERDSSVFKARNNASQSEATAKIEYMEIFTIRTRCSHLCDCQCADKQLPAL